jgi:hypothetical protein
MDPDLSSRLSHWRRLCIPVVLPVDSFRALDAPGGHMYASDSSREHVERDPHNEQRGRLREDEIVIDRKPIVADRPRDDDAWPAAPGERRRTERRRIERMGTDT